MELAIVKFPLPPCHIVLIMYLLLSTLFSNSLNLWSFFKARHEVSQQYATERPD
jgi:hypothetical protein